jgi:ubiquinone/menaquinone biosynthesis C-methylase UbiE
MVDDVARAPRDARLSHRALIVDQFERQAAIFARAPALHNAEILSLLVEAAEPRADDETLDVACGPGTIVAAFAPRVRRAVGLDATEAMLAQARDLTIERKLTNVDWQLGDVYHMPFPDFAFDIVSCRFAFHHFQEPERAFAEMIRVCRVGGRIVLCDAVASEHPEKAAAFNRMERHRDPSTIEFRPLAFLTRLFAEANLAIVKTVAFQVPAEIERMIASSFPAGGDREKLRAMIEDSIDGDTMAMNVRREHGTITLAYPSVVLVARKPAADAHVAPTEYAKNCLKEVSDGNSTLPNRRVHHAPVRGQSCCRVPAGELARRWDHAGDRDRE